MEHRDTPAGTTGLEIAIVGMAGRFPGADDVDAFWDNIRGGVESVRSFTDEELARQGVPRRLLDQPGYVKAGVVFEGVDRFDAGFFGYSPREAELLDPQQRIFLECAWTALEHAGCDTQRWPGKVGVYAGEGTNLYLLRHLLPSFELNAGTGIAELLGLLSANAGSALCTRVAYKLNLRGPAVTVQTACSTSLVAVHTACQALLGHDCDMALAGGVWLNLLQGHGYLHQGGAILSSDGHCRAFDAQATGTVVGSGAGIVVLKRLADALRDGDEVHAVIKASASNNDGSDKVGFTAPSINGQAGVVRAAQLLADVPARSIGYVEAHGTGTVLGDPIEVAALTQAFRASTADRGFCALGSAKTQIGHLDAAAGVAGLIRATLALKHKTLPPSLHFESPNPQIDFGGSPFYVNTQARPWPETGTPRRAGVSSFGIGGTNVHVVLEEAPPAAPAAPAAAAWQVLPLSAQHPAALMQAADNLAGHLQRHPYQPLADVAHTLQAGRRAFPWRCAVVGDGHDSAVQALLAPGGVRDQPPTRLGDTAAEVAFLFPGGGAHHVNMALALYRGEPVFRDEVDRCCELLRATLGTDLRALVYPAAGADEEARADALLARIENTQPALFVVEYAMARLWMSRGVQPAVMLGHSLGEYVAACLAGVFSLEDALDIVAARGRLMQSMAPGAMTAVPLAEAELAASLRDMPPGCDIAAVNGAQLCVLAGPLAAIEAAEQRLSARGLTPRRLHVSIASHSAMTEPIADALRQVIAAVPRHAPRIPFISNLTGALITAEQAVSPDYWARHLRDTVRFEGGLAALLSTPGRVVLEVGPGDTLTRLARQHALAGSAAAILPSQAHPQQQARNSHQMAQALAGLWCAGVDIDWAACQPAGAPRRRVVLPGYAFQRQSYWVDAPQGSAGAPRKAQVPQAFGEGGRHVADTFYVPAWKRTEPPPADGVAAQACTLVFGDATSLTDRLLRTLHGPNPEGAAKPVVWVERGDGYRRIDTHHYVLQAAERADHERLLREVQAGLGPVSAVHHLWSVDAQAATSQAPSNDALERGFFSLLALTQALDTAVLGDRGPRSVGLTVVTSGMEDATGLEPLCPEKSTVSGLCRVIGQEYPQLDCRVVDVVPPPPESEAETWLARQLLAEGRTGPQGTVVAYRGPHRLLKAYEPLARSPEQSRPPRLRRGGTYLVTGGLGGVGLSVARRFAQEWGANLVLVGRTPLPPRGDWARVSQDAGQPPLLRHKLRELMEVEALGGQLLALSADVADEAAVRAVVDQAHERFGPIHGVIHTAGHAKSGMIGDKTRAMVDAVFAPKLRGTRLLMDALRGEPLDFVLLCSSVASLAGGLGKCDYAAANAYLDGLAAAARRGAGAPVFSVNWDAWRDLGMAAGMKLPDGVGMDGPQGALALECIVNGPSLPQVVVSTTDLELRLGDIGGGMLDMVEQVVPEAQASGRRLHPRPPLQTAYAAPEGELQPALAGLWQDMLGITPIGARDNLFELGGDSLLAIQLLARVRQAYGVELHPAAFFKAPTVEALALAVEDRLIDEIEEVQP